MANVLQFIGSFHQGGSERQAVQLTRLLCKAGKHKIFVATLNNEGVLKNEIESLGFTEIPEFKLTSFYDLNFIKQLKKCARFLRENKIEIIHTHDFYTNVFGILAARLAKVKVKIASKRETGGMRSNLQKNIEKQMFKIADHIVVNAEAVKRYLISEAVSANKINVIYNGLDLERLTPKITDKKKICEYLKLPAIENAKFITLVANLRHEVKNQPMFLRVAKRVLQKNSNAHFVLAGEGELRESLEKMAYEEGIAENVHLIGRCTQIPELLFVSFACVLTSFNEGFSNSILEYMFAGKPVVATNVGGANEAIIENKTGFLVKSDDDEEMADRLSQFLTSEEKAALFGQKAKNVIEVNFSCEAQLNNTHALYEKALNGKY